MTERAQDERDEKLHSLRVPLPKPYRDAATMIVNDVWYKCVHFNEEESWIDNAKAVALTQATLEKLCKGFEQLAEQYKKIAEDAIALKPAPSIFLTTKAEQAVEKAAFEKACKAVCDACAQGVPMEDGSFHRSSIRLRRSQQTFVRTTLCRARPIRAAFPHLAETEKK